MWCPQSSMLSWCIIEISLWFMQFMLLVTRIFLRTRPTNKTLGPHIATWIKLQRQNRLILSLRTEPHRDQMGSKPSMGLAIASEWDDKNRNQLRSEKNMCHFFCKYGYVSKGALLEPKICSRPNTCISVKITCWSVNVPWKFDSTWNCI
jgi:hypothetical protein